MPEIYFIKSRLYFSTVEILNPDIFNRCFNFITHSCVEIRLLICMVNAMKDEYKPQITLITQISISVLSLFLL